MTFVWNKEWDEEQVAEHLPAFLAVYEEVKRPGDFAYNDSFKGRIPEIAGEWEDRAIYLLQGLRRKRIMEARVRELEADGYRDVETLDDLTRCEGVALVPTRRMGGEFVEYQDVRLVPRDGRPYGVLPKGKRTRGYAVNGRRVLAKIV
jgi:hypothetical protein